mgnify:CR=1 FL=1
MSKKKFGKKKSTQIPNLTKTILDIIRKRPNQNFNYKQIASQLNITDASGRNQIIKKLSQLAAKQQIVEVCGAQQGAALLCAERVMPRRAQSPRGGFGRARRPAHALA